MPSQFDSLQSQIAELRERVQALESGKVQPKVNPYIPKPDLAPLKVLRADSFTTAAPELDLNNIGDFVHGR